MALVIGLQHCPQRVHVGWIWRPLVFGSEIRAVGLEPVLRGTSCVCWRAVLLKDVSTGQKSSAVVDKTGKETANVVRRIHFSARVNKAESSLATKTHASRDHHMLRTQTSHAWRQLSCRPTRLYCSGCWQEGLDKKKFSSVKKTRFVSRTLSRRSRIFNDFRAQVVVHSFWGRWNR